VAAMSRHAKRILLIRDGLSVHPGLTIGAQKTTTTSEIAI